MTIDATFNERNTMLEAKFGVLSKGEKGDALTFDDLTEEQKAELSNAKIVGNHEKRITNLEKKLAPEYFATDASSAHNKVVPSNACPFALVNKVGGMTYKCNNLFDQMTLAERSVYYSVDSSGVTLLKNDGVANNTVPPSGTLEAGEYTMFSTLPNACSFRVYDIDGNQVMASSNGTKTFTLTAPTTIRVKIVAIGDFTYPVKVGNIAIVRGSTALPYEPYFEGLRDTKVTELVSEGANLIPYPFYETTKTTNGITFKDNGDGSITISGTASADAYFFVQRNCDYGESGINAMNTESATNGTYSANKRLYYNYVNKTLSINIKSGSSVNEILYPMVNRGTTALPFKPYRGTIDTFPISAELRAFLEDKGYGRGVEGYPNYIDFERKVFAQKVSEIDMGSLNYEYRTSNGRNMFRVSLVSLGIQEQISANIPINALAEDYRAVSCNATWIDRDMAYGSTVVGYQAIEFVDNRYTNANDFKAAVSGKKLLFALETPIETDISAYLDDDNFIEVEGGGVIKAVNEHGLDAPTEIIYMLKEGGAE